MLTKKGYLVGQNWQIHTNVIKLWPLSVRKKECRGIGQNDETMERFQMGPTLGLAISEDAK